MTKKLRIKIICMIFALFVAVYATGTVFAWFSSQVWDLDLAGNSAGAYFAYGDGTDVKRKFKKTGEEVGEPWIEGEDDLSEWDMATGPFGINHPIHMFNLAWLQNTGRFKSDTRTFHFELADDVSMNGATGNVVLPPIGNKEYPFDSVFNGNGHIIGDLIISTNKKVLYGNPNTEGYTFSNAVGLFGMTTEDSQIENFILAYPTVEVSDGANGAETKYDPPTDKDPSAVGLAVGYVAGKVHSIGVLGGTLAVRKTQYATYNSILGFITPAALEDSNITGNGPNGGSTGSEGSGNAFGATFDINGIYDRLELIAGNNGASFRMPNVIVTKDANTGKITDIKLDKHEKLPFTIISSQSSYEGPDAFETVSTTNIGYLLGSENHADTATVTFGERLIKQNGSWVFPDGGTPDSEGLVPRWIYRQVGTYAGEADYRTEILEELSPTDMNDLPEDIRALIPNSNVEITLESFRIGYKYDNQGVRMYFSYGAEPEPNFWGMNGQISWNGQTYGQGFERNKKAADENGAYYDGYQDGGKWYPTGYMLDDNLNIFRYNEDGSRHYAAGVTDQNFVITEDGYYLCKQLNDYCTDDYGQRFNVFGDYDLHSDGLFYYPNTNNPVHLKHNWLGERHAGTMKGLQIPFWSYLGGIALPDNGMWFKPVQEGTIRLLMFGHAEEGQSGFSLFRLKRTAATEDNPFAITHPIDDGDISGGIQVMGEDRYAVPNNVLVFLDLPFSQEDIDNDYEFWLTLNDSSPSQPHFIYMDLGSSKADDDGKGPTDQADSTKTVTAIDFIYKDVNITQKDITLEDGTTIPKGSFVIGSALYVQTYTKLSFGGSGAIVAFYYRKDEQSANSVTINAAYKATANTIVSSNANKASISTTIPASWPDVVDGNLHNSGWTLS